MPTVRGICGSHTEPLTSQAADCMGSPSIVDPSFLNCTVKLQVPDSSLLSFEAVWKESGSSNVSHLPFWAISLEPPISYGSASIKNSTGPSFLHQNYDDLLGQAIFVTSVQLNAAKLSSNSSSHPQTTKMSSKSQAASKCKS